MQQQLKKNKNNPNIEVPKKELAAKTIESIDLLKMFALDESVNYNMYSWKTGADLSNL